MQLLHDEIKTNNKYIGVNNPIITVMMFFYRSNANTLSEIIR